MVLSKTKRTDDMDGFQTQDTWLVSQEFWQDVWHVNEGLKHAHESSSVKVSSFIKKAVRHLQLFPGPTEYPLCLAEANAFPAKRKKNIYHKEILLEVRKFLMWCGKNNA